MAADGSEARADAVWEVFVCVGVCFWVLVGVGKSVKKLALVGLDPTTFGL